MIGRRQLLAIGAALALPGSARADVNDTARWVAGLAGGSGDEWNAYARTENERWAALEARRRALRAFFDAELKAVVPADATLFYPFGGPDLLHASALFPVAKRIVLVGLEPIGTVPVPPPAGYFGRLGTSLDELHRIGFFRTADMASDFARDGVSGVLLATIARLGGTVERLTPTTGPAAIRIDYKLDGDSRRVDYVNTDLSNAGLRSWPGAAALAPHVTLIKAGMYLLAEPRFSQLRQLLLDGTSVLVQDDTGIPYRSLRERFATRLFGSYEAPRKPFEERLQPELRSAYASKPPRPLAFGFGYAIEARRSNLLVGTRST